MAEERLNNLRSVPNIDERFNRLSGTVDRGVQTMTTRAQIEEDGYLREIGSIYSELRVVKRKVDTVMQENAQLRKDNAELKETVETHTWWRKVGLGLATVAIVVPAACWGISKLFG